MSRQKNHQFLYPVKISLKNKGELRMFSNEGKPGDFITSCSKRNAERSTLDEGLKKDK
jgi:hypothetical protein